MRPQTRIDNPKKINVELIEEKISLGEMVIIQFSSEVYTSQILEELNLICKKFSANLGIRFYGFYSSIFDCSVLQNIPNVKSLLLDCLMDVDNIQEITKLNQLERLSLGIYNLSESNILESSNFKNLQELILGDTKTTALDLTPLKSYQKLNYLIICGHKKGLAVIGKLDKLKFLGLNSISKVSIQFINSLKYLKTLHFVLGGRTDINEIQNNNIEHLEIIRVRGFNDFSNISNFKNLKTLKIEDQIKLTEIEFIQENDTIKEIIIFNCKNLESIKGLAKLKGLKYIKIYKTALHFEEFISQSNPSNIENVTFRTTRKKDDIYIESQLREMGYQTGP